MQRLSNFLGNRNYATVSSQSVREHRLWCSQSLCKFHSWVHSFWCHLVNSCSKTVFKYSDFLLLELKNIVGILEFVLPERNIEESRLLAILLDRNSKHAGKRKDSLAWMYIRNSDGASSSKTDFFETRKG